MIIKRWIFKRAIEMGDFGWFLQVDIKDVGCFLSKIIQSVIEDVSVVAILIKPFSVLFLTQSSPIVAGRVILTNQDTQPNLTKNMSPSVEFKIRIE